MARLPVPGNDEGTWGEVLNDFLLASHDSDGVLKPGSVGAAQLQSNAVTNNSVADGSITQAKVQNLVSDLAATEKTANRGASNGYAPLDSSGKVPSINLPTSTDATTGTKGVIQLAGDLGGTAASPTVPGLAAKADSSTVVQLAGSNVSTLGSSALQYLRINIPNDGSDTATWPDRMAFYYTNVRTGYHNEYGELRARPAKSSTVALRAMGFSSGSSGDIFQVSAADASTTYLGVSQTQITANVPVITPNLPRKITTSATPPANPQDGDIWFDTSGN